MFVFTGETRSMKNVPFDPYIPSEKKLPEFTFKAVLLGILFGLLFGATTVYLGLKVGLTVSASIPIAVLGISILKKFCNSTILENNIMQTIGSAGESIAAGVVFTLPALLFLADGKEYFHYFQIFVLALVGGILGVLFMIPLRRVLIVQEHHRLPYPEGTACADVLIAGEKGGSLAEKVFYGIGIALFYKLLMSILGFWKEVPKYIFSKQSPLPNAMISAEVTPELFGVGYIVGPRIGGIMLAGGVLSNLALIPIITFFGESLTTVLAPGTKLISQMSSHEIWSQYVRYIGAGAVAFSGILTMIRTFPMIIKSFRSTIHSIREKNKNGLEKNTSDRTDKDLPLSVVIIGALLLVFTMALLPNIPVTFASAFLIIIAGFFFVTVSSRIVGLIGTSSNPVSGMTITTLMGTCLFFIANGWTSDVYQPIALCVGGIVCIAAANAGAISQDLKTGYIVGSTPMWQQIGMIIGVVTSVFAIGYTLLLLNDTIGFGEATAAHPHPLPAPQATLMATIIKGMLSQNLPWGLVMMGMAISAVIELCGINSLPFAVGTYLPFSTSSAICFGGLVKWLVNKFTTTQTDAHSELEPGTLYSSGLIAGGSLAGIFIAALMGTNYMTQPDGTSVSYFDMVNTQWGEHLGIAGDFLSLGIFAILAATVFWVATRKQPPRTV